MTQRECGGHFSPLGERIVPPSFANVQSLALMDSMRKHADRSEIPGVARFLGTYEQADAPMENPPGLDLVPLFVRLVDAVILLYACLNGGLQA